MVSQEGFGDVFLMTELDFFKAGFYMKRKAFTLIELLVVIAVIGLLMAVVVPALLKAKQAAWNIVCRSNLRQYGLAGTMYTEENDAMFPNAWGSIFKSVDEPQHPRECQWHDQTKNPVSRPDLAGSLWPYLGEQDKSHLCPVFDRFARVEHDCPYDIPMEPIFSYSMNAMLGGFEMTGPIQYVHILRVRTSEVRSPASIFFFGEENPWINADRYEATLNDNALCGTPAHPADDGAWTTPADQMVSSTNPDGLKYWDSLATFHKTSFERKDEGESNVVYVDGHVGMENWENTYKRARWTRKMPVLHE